MDFATWIDVLYATVFVIAMFMLIGYKRVKTLWPIGVLSSIMLLSFQYLLILFGWIKYNKGLIFIAGTPAFQLIWAFANGIIVISYMTPNWLGRLPRLLVFTLILESMSFISLKVGHLSFLNGWNYWYDALTIFLLNAFGVWAAEKLFRERIYERIDISNDI